jgi:DNA-binding beta-propeller fold protein YncE
MRRRLPLVLGAFVAIVTLLAGFAAAFPSDPPLEAIIETPGSPFASLSSPTGTFLFVSVTAGPNSGVAVYNLRDDGVKQINFIRISGGAYGLAFLPGRWPFPDTGTLFVGDDDGVAIVDATTAERGLQQMPIQVVDGVNAMTTQVIFSYDFRYIFAADKREASISIIRLEHRTDGRIGGVRVATVAVDSMPTGLAISPHGRFLYATSEIASLSQPAAGSDDPRLSRTACLRAGTPGVTPNGVLTTIDVAKAEKGAIGVVISRVASGCSPVRVVVTYGGNVAYVSVRGDDRVLEFSTQKLRSDPAHALTASLPVGPAPIGLAFADVFPVVADSNPFAGQTASVLQLLMFRDNPKVISTIEAGVSPRNLSVSYGGAMLYVTNAGSDDVMAFWIPALIFGNQVLPRSTVAMLVPPADWTPTTKVSDGYLYSIWAKHVSATPLPESIAVKWWPSAKMPYLAKQTARDLESLGYSVRMSATELCGAAANEEWAAAPGQDSIQFLFESNAQNYDGLGPEIIYRHPAGMAVDPGAESLIHTCNSPSWRSPPGYEGVPLQAIRNVWIRRHSVEQIAEFAGPISYTTRQAFEGALLRISTGHAVRTALNVIATSNLSLCGRPAIEARVIVIGQSQSDIESYDVVVTQSDDETYTLEYRNAGGRFDPAVLDAMHHFCPN